MWPGAGDGEKINYNSIEIDGQLNVSSPHRVVIAHCSLIEVGQEGREGGGTPEDPGGPPVEGEVVPSALTQQRQHRSAETLIIHLGGAEAKPAARGRYG